LLGARAASTSPTDGGRGARNPDLAAATSGRGESQQPKEFVDESGRGLLKDGPSVFSGHWHRREDPHRVGGVAARDATRVALANLTNFKLGRSSSRNPNECNDGEENGTETNEHVGVDEIELDFLVANDSEYTHFLYLEFLLLCP